MAKPWWQRALGWGIDKGSEAIFQDQVTSSSFGQWLKQKIPALLGGSAVTALGAWLWNNWIPACTSGLITIVLLMYAQAFVWAIRGRRDAAKVPAPEAPAASTQLLPPAPTATPVKAIPSEPVEQVVRMVSTEDALRIALPNVLGPDPLAAIDPTKPIVVKRPIPTVQSSGRVTVHSPSGSVPLRGIVVVRDLLISLRGDSQHPRLACECTTVLYGFGPDLEASPWELKIMAKGSPSTLVLLKTKALARSTAQAHTPGTTTYEGELDPYQMSDLLREIKRQMTGDPNGSTPSGKLYCWLEVHLPEGFSADPHRESGIKMDFELDNSTKREFLVEVPRRDWLVEGF
jgi:hypothetical protein